MKEVQLTAVEQMLVFSALLEKKKELEKDSANAANQILIKWINELLLKL